MSDHAKHSHTHHTEQAAMPVWVPKDAQRYLAHTEGGLSIRALARTHGCAPSTIMRQVRRIEQKRDDPLVDEALEQLRSASLTSGASDAAHLSHRRSTARPHKEAHLMENRHTSPVSQGDAQACDDLTLEREGRRILRRLSEPQACLAVAKDMDKAVVVRELSDGRTTRTAILDRSVAQMLALKGWIEAQVKGKITRYTITAAGRTAYREFLAVDESARAGVANGSGEGRDGWLGAGMTGLDPRKGTQTRYTAIESPVLVLARRRDKDGTLFLRPEVVAAAERLREDFELSQIGMETPPDWDAFLAGGARAWSDRECHGFGAGAARARVAAALDELGAGLGDVALRCCCRLEGMEAAEQCLGWSARSGKIVLRIALERLKRHYDRAGYSNLIG
ncbi:DUF6456 domain-containing protein [Celeribacter marinus]|uniref:DUF6456 domain-containing protein n=1 Tax=Celeribacter marinus TaxID=1397108 RepID=UPI00317EF962